MSKGFHMSFDEFKRKFPEEAEKLSQGKAPAKPFSNAKPTQATWITGQLVTFASKMEANVAMRLVRDVRLANEEQKRVNEERRRSGLADLPMARIYRQVRIPLFSIAPRDDASGKGTPYYLSVDFVIVNTDGSRRYIDAKSKYKSSDWARGRAAAQAELGITVEETER